MSSSLTHQFRCLSFINNKKKDQSWVVTLNVVLRAVLQLTNNCYFIIWKQQHLCMCHLNAIFLFYFYTVADCNWIYNIEGVHWNLMDVFSSLHWLVLATCILKYLYSGWNIRFVNSGRVQNIFIDIIHLCAMLFVSFWGNDARIRNENCLAWFVKMSFFLFRFI